MVSFDMYFDMIPELLHWYFTVDQINSDENYMSLIVNGHEIIAQEHHIMSLFLEFIYHVIINIFFGIKSTMAITTFHSAISEDDFVIWTHDDILYVVWVTHSRFLNSTCPK